MSMFMRLTALAVLSVAMGAFAAIGPVTDLHIVNKNISPDGVNRSAVLAEGTFPGPLITGKKGDNFRIKVFDELTDDSMLLSTSIHWHGFFQKGTNWADGPAFVNQCPISTGHSFLYNFNVPDQAGTFWYHSHLSTQYCDGLRGPLVVYDPDDPHAHLYDVDDESTIITLSDWYHGSARAAGKFAVFSSILINGLGRFTNAQGTTGSLAVIDVQPGKRYRMRLVSMSCDPNFVFSIDGHDMTIIEADGINTDPLQVNSIQIFAAQRYSFVLEANQPVENYWIRANPPFGSTGFAGGINSAILRYSGAPNTEPTTTQPTASKALNEVDLHPLTNPGAPGNPTQGGADVNLNFLLAFNNSAGEFTINGKSFHPPTVPVLLQILSGAQPAQNLLPAGSVYSLPRNKVIELSLPGGVIGGGHPFHLHGHAFDVIRSAGSSTYNYANPVRRDVVNIGGLGDNVTIRWTTDNPGPWFLHCHIDWHLEAGFAVVFAEDTPDVASANPVPDAWKDLCPTYNALPPSQI